MAFGGLTLGLALCVGGVTGPLEHPAAVGSPPADIAECVSTDMMFIDMPGPDSEVALLQTRLIELGYDSGEVDGYFGPDTFVATAASQAPYSDGTSGGNGIFADEGTVLGTEVFERLGIACGVADTAAEDVDLNMSTPPSSAVVDPNAAEDGGPAQRIEFPAGADSGTVSDTVAAGAVDRFVFRAEAGQYLQIATESTGGTSVFTVSTPGGAQLSGPGVRSWNGTLPEGGDYRLEVASVGSAAVYSLSLRITPGPANTTVTSTERVRFAPGTGGAVIEGSAAPGAGVRYLLGAAIGQWMTVTLTSGAATAAFTVLAPDGSNLSGVPTQTWAGTLPADGDYVVDVTSPAPTRFTVAFTIDASAPAAPPAPPAPPAGNLSPLPAGATLSNPVLLQRDGESVLTDGRYAITPLPGQLVRQATVEPDGTVVLLADDVVATVAPDGVVRSVACPDCSGLAVNGDTIVLTRDPGSGSVFEFVFVNRQDLSGAGSVAAARTVDPNPYPDDDRQYWDTPLVHFADGAGIVVTYDYRPGGMNARGGDETVVARYSSSGELLASNQIGGRVDVGVLSPDRRFVALAFGGSFGACYTVGEPGVVDLATLTVSFPPAAGGDGTTWFQLDPYWDDQGVLHAIGERFFEPPVDIDDAYCQIMIEPWERSYDTATGTWSEHAASGLTRWIGPACTDVLALEVIRREVEDGQGGVQVTARLDNGTRELGRSGWVQLGRSTGPDCT